MELMCYLLNLLKFNKHGHKTLDFDSILEGPTKDFAEKWIQVLNTEFDEPHSLPDIIEKKIEPIIPEICSKVIESMNGSEYTAKEYSNKTPKLGDLIVNMIPPNEEIDFDNEKTINTNVVSILNAGWEVYLSHMDDFAKNYLKLNYQDNKLKCNKKLNEILLKAVELNEIKTRWDEIGND
jgi:hypothetical protein